MDREREALEYQRQQLIRRDSNHHLEQLARQFRVNYSPAAAVEGAARPSGSSCRASTPQQLASMPPPAAHQAQPAQAQPLYNNKDIQLYQSGIICFSEESVFLFPCTCTPIFTLAHKVLHPRLCLYFLIQVHMCPSCLPWDSDDFWTRAQSKPQT